MSGKIQMVGLVILGVMLSFLVLVYFAVYSSRRDINTVLQSDAKTEIYANRDDSARLVKGSFYLQRSDFETGMKSKFASQMTTSTSNVDMSFSFKADSNGDSNSISGVTITTKYKGQTYYTNVVLSKGQWQNVSPNDQSANVRYK